MADRSRARVRLMAEELRPRRRAAPVTLPSVSERRKHSIDYAGTTLLALGLSGIILLTTLGGNTYAWGSAQIVALGAAAGAHVVQPSVAPSEMKVSVQLALEYISHFAPQSTDAWLLAPADMPGLAASTIDALVGAYESSLVADPNAAPRIWAPRCGGRRGRRSIRSGSARRSSPISIAAPSWSPTAASSGSGCRPGSRRRRA